MFGGTRKGGEGEWGRGGDVGEEGGKRGLVSFPSLYISPSQE